MKLESIEAMARALNAAGVPFIVVGGLAVNAHGYGRLTWDVDLVVPLRPDIIHGAFGALASLGYRPRVPVTAEGFGDPVQRARWSIGRPSRKSWLRTSRYGFCDLPRW